MLDISGEMIIIGLVNKPGLSVSSTVVIRSTIIGINWLEYQAINVIFFINEIVEL
jgi:phosphate/sulfate permease